MASLTVFKKKAPTTVKRYLLRQTQAYVAAVAIFPHRSIGRFFVLQKPSTGNNEIQVRRHLNNSLIRAPLHTIFRKKIF